jgi:hypothetical protein
MYFKKLTKELQNVPEKMLCDNKNDEILPKRITFLEFCGKVFGIPSLNIETHFAEFCLQKIVSTLYFMAKMKIFTKNVLRSLKTSPVIVVQFLELIFLNC